MAIVERMILVVMDGLRPDGLLQANMPFLRSLMESGAYTLSARTVMPSVTLPVHMTMFHSLLPEAHGVFGNTWHPMPGEQVQGITEVVRAAGRKACFYTTWDPLRDLARPGALSQSIFFNMYDYAPEVVDVRIAQIAAESIIQEKPDFSFVYLGVPDEIAHRSGWMSPPYLDALAFADQGLAHLLEQLEKTGLLAETAVLVLSDHGGHDHTHGSDLPEDMIIPWILTGPGVRRGHEIKAPVSMLDTAPTIAHLLDLPIPAAWQGQIIHEALE